MSHWKLILFIYETESTFICNSNDSKSALEPYYYSEHYLNGFFILTTTIMNSLTHISNQKSTKYAICSNLKLIKVPLNYPFILICHSKFRIPQCLPSFCTETDCMNICAVSNINEISHVMVACFHQNMRPAHIHLNGHKGLVKSAK